MARTIALAVSVSFLLLGPVSASPAQAADTPKIGYQAAQKASYSVLRKVSLWRYRDRGSLNCGRGRISRSEWSCRFQMRKGRTCGAGRIRVKAYFNEFGRIKLNSHLRGRRYSC